MKYDQTINLDGEHTLSIGVHPTDYGNSFIVGYALKQQGKNLIRDHASFDQIESPQDISRELRKLADSIDKWCTPEGIEVAEEYIKSKDAQRKK